LLDGLRRFIRGQFTRVVLVGEEPQKKEGIGVAGVRASRIRKRKLTRVAVSPSERFVWGMVTLIIALVGVIALEIVCILVTGAFNSELLAVISGLVGSLVTAFVMGKKS